MDSTDCTLDKPSKKKVSSPPSSMVQLTEWLWKLLLSPRAIVGEVEEVKEEVVDEEEPSEKVVAQAVVMTGIRAATSEGDVLRKPPNPRPQVPSNKSVATRSERSVKTVLAAMTLLSLSCEIRAIADPGGFDLCSTSALTLAKQGSRSNNCTCLHHPLELLQERNRHLCFVACVKGYEKENLHRSLVPSRSAKFLEQFFSWLHTRPEKGP